MNRPSSSFHHRSNTAANNATSTTAPNNNSSSNNTITNPYVQSRSIQSTLNALTNETQGLRQETRRLDAQRVALQERLKQHAQLQQQRDHDIRVAQDAVGQYHRQRTMLTQEQTRLEQQLAAEKQDMQTCATEYAALLQREKERKQQFCKDVEEANKELGGILKQKEEERILQKITPACLPLIQQVFEKANNGGTSNAAAGGGTADNGMEKAQQAFFSATQHLDQAVAEKQQLQREIETLRNMALQGTGGAAGKNLTKDMLLNLESVWRDDWQSAQEEEENQQRGGASSTAAAAASSFANQVSSPVHMQLFYNQVGGGGDAGDDDDDQEQQEESMTVVNDADAEFMPPPPPPPPPPQVQQQEHAAVMTAAP